MSKSIAGNEYISNQGQRFLVTEKVEGKRRYKVRFYDTGYETEATYTNIWKGAVRDRFHKNICGVACLGNAIAAHHQREYDLWHGMIQRCYYPNNISYIRYGAKGVSVSERWLCFENFLEDIPKIEGFNKERFYLGELNLDKDVKQSDKDMKNRIYSLETCMFLTVKANREHSNRQFQKDFVAYSPQGKEYESFNITKFAQDHNLTFQAISKCLKGQLKQHKGWTFRYK